MHSRGSCTDRVNTQYELLDVQCRYRKEKSIELNSDPPTYHGTSPRRGDKKYGNRESLDDWNDESHRPMSPRTRELLEYANAIKELPHQ